MKSNIKAILLPLIILVVVFGLGDIVGCGKSQEATEESTTEGEAVVQPETEEEGAIYICPMHPEETSTDPNAECSTCGMNLLPAEEVESEQMFEE